MLTQDEYLVAWTIYIVAALGLIGALWMLLRRIVFVMFRRVLLTISAVLLLMPWYSYDDNDFLAPAFIISAFEALTKDFELWSRAGGPLLIAIAVGFTLTILFTIAFPKT